MSSSKFGCTGGTSGLRALTPSQLTLEVETAPWRLLPHPPRSPRIRNFKNAKRRAQRVPPHQHGRINMRSIQRNVTFRGIGRFSSRRIPMSILRVVGWQGPAGARCLAPARPERAVWICAGGCFLFVLFWAGGGGDCRMPGVPPCRNVLFVLAQAFQNSPCLRHESFASCRPGRGCHKRRDLPEQADILCLAWVWHVLGLACLKSTAVCTRSFPYD